MDHPKRTGSRKIALVLFAFFPSKFPSSDAQSPELRSIPVSFGPARKRLALSSVCVLDKEQKRPPARETVLHLCGPARLFRGGSGACARFFRREWAASLLCGDTCGPSKHLGLIERFAVRLARFFARLSIAEDKLRAEEEKLHCCNC